MGKMYVIGLSTCTATVLAYMHYDTDLPQFVAWSLQYYSQD